MEFDGIRRTSMAEADKLSGPARAGPARRGPVRISKGASRRSRALFNHFHEKQLFVFDVLEIDFCFLVTPRNPKALLRLVLVERTPQGPALSPSIGSRSLEPRQLSESWLVLSPSTRSKSLEPRRVKRFAAENRLEARKARESPQMLPAGAKPPRRALA